MAASKKITTPEQKRLRELVQRIAQEPQFGSVAGLADKMEPKMVPQAIYKWVYTGRIPIEKAVQSERMTAGKYDRRMLCPWAFL